jgi:hypothetical protein
MQNNEGELIKSSNSMTKEEMILLREQFITDYSKKRGWDKNNLSPDQLIEIVEQREYKSPGLLKS